MATVKVVPVSTPKAAPVAAVKVQTVKDSPVVAPSPNGGIQLSTASGIVQVQPGDYVVPDGAGGYKCVPAAFFSLFYAPAGN